MNADLSKIKPRFRKFVEEAWRQGETLPEVWYWTEDEIEQVNRILKKWKERVDNV